MSETVAATPEATNVAPIEQPSVPTAPKKEEFDLSRRFAALAKREKQIREMEQKAKEQWGEVEKVQKSKKSARENIDLFLKEHGLDYKQVTDYYLNDQKPTLEQKLMTLEERIEQDRIKREEAAKIEEDEKVNRTIEGHKRQVKDFIDSKPDEFELIKAHDAHDTVFETIEAYWQKTGQILPIDEAAKHIEEEFEGEIKKLLELKKTKGFLQPKSEVLEAVEPELKNAPPPTPSSSTPPKMVTTSPKTLTNSMASQAAPSQTSEYLSEEESKKRLAEFLRSQMR